MAADNLGPVQPQRIENGLSSRMMYTDEAIHFSRAVGDDHSAPKLAAAAAGFAIDGERSRFGRSQYRSQNPSWNLDGRPHSDGSDGEDEEDDGDDDDDDKNLDEGDGLVSLDENNNVKNGHNSSGSVQSSSEKGNGENARNLQEHHSPFGLSRGVLGKDGNLSDQQQHERVGNYDNAITVVQPELYRTEIMNGGDDSSSCQKEIRGENGHGFGARKEGEP